MNAPILHHYAVSPFAEKIRTILAYKKIAWQSVQIKAEWTEAGRWLSLIRSRLAVAAEP